VDDILVMCPNTVKLRHERMGGGDGRVYSITYRVAADNGITADATVYAYVPHDDTDYSAGDDGAGYTVVPECGDED
jgi:hypothetical protein